MKKKVVISGSLQDMVTYCTAIYNIEGKIKEDELKSIVENSPIYEDKNFYTNVLGHVSKTTVTRKTKIFIHDFIVTLQIRYEILKVVDIELTEKDEQWIKHDINKLLEHFELLLTPFTEEGFTGGDD